MTMTYEEIRDAQIQLEADADLLKEIPIDKCTERELHIRLAYHMWNDGAPWEVVHEMQNDWTLTRESMINTLKDGFNL